MELGRSRIPESELNLYYTLFSGQCFGWDEGEGGFSGFFRWDGATRHARLRREGDLVLYETDAPPDWFSRYFNLRININEVYESFPDDPMLKEAVKRFRGMRVLGQDPWEALVSFTVSQNNNIKRIRLIIRRMVEAFGRFPEPEDLTNESLLLRLGLGYRARYLVGIAEKTLSGEFDPARPQEISGLLCLPGVGKKVAQCTLLYGYGVNHAFPVDRWIKRLVGSCPDYGPYAGWAQLYLYMLAREGGIAPPEAKAIYFGNKGGLR